jgi:hypothetical protein
MREIRRKIQADSEGMLLVILLTLSHSFGYTSPHDKVYALLGLSTEIARASTRIDYSKAQDQVFLEAARMSFLLDRAE